MGLNREIKIIVICIFYFNIDETADGSLVRCWHRSERVAAVAHKRVMARMLKSAVRSPAVKLN